MAKRKMKMWCLCRKKDGMPIKLSFGSWSNKIWVIGLSTKVGLLEAIDCLINDDEEIRRIEFKY